MPSSKAKYQQKRSPDYLPCLDDQPHVPRQPFPADAVLALARTLSVEPDHLSCSCGDLQGVGAWAAVGASVDGRFLCLTASGLPTRLAAVAAVLAAAKASRRPMSCLPKDLAATRTSR